MENKNGVSFEIMPGDEPVKETSKFDAGTYDLILQAIQKDATQIIQNARLQGIELTQAMVQEVKRELQEIRSSSKSVMHVKVNDSDYKKLTTEAVPYLPRMIIHAKVGLNTLLVGPAGCGKSFSANQLAEALGLEFGHLNLTAGASETWLFGRQTPNGFIEAPFSKLYKTGGVFLADEIDAADANLMLSINTAIAGNHLYNPISGETIPRHKDFVFVGAANTYGKGADSKYTGRSRLDAATLDRFVMLKVDYNTAIEEKLCTNISLRNVLWAMREKLIELGAQEFISTRAMQIAQRQFDGGVSIVDILESISLSWPEDLRDQVKAEVRKLKESGSLEKEKKPGRPSGSKNKAKESSEVPF